MAFSTTGNGVLLWRHEHETLRIEPWGTDGLRVRARVHGEILDEPHALLPLDTPPGEISLAEDGAAVRNGRIEARVSGAGRVCFHHTSTGEPLLEEVWWKADQPPLWPLARSFHAVGGDLFRVEQRFQAYAGERLYGLGQHRHGYLDQKGCVVDLYPRNAEVPIPFLLSSRGYGLLWNNAGVGRVELGLNGTRWVTEGTRQIDYYVTAGDCAQIMARYADATGHAPLLPEWAAGFWQCKLRYRTQEELLSVAREYRRRGLPLSVIVVDFFHWSRLGDWDWDPECWPDPAGMIRELESMGVKLMVSIWPAVNPNSRNAAELAARGLLVGTDRGIPVLFPFVDVHDPGRVFVYYYDATHPEAREFIWQQVREHYHRLGVKLFWLDACEPEIYPMDFDNLRYHEGPGLATAGLYPLRHAQAFYEGMRAAGQEDIINLCRSAWAGSQRYAAAVWSGDVESTFEVLRAQVRAGLNIGLSGIPWWTTDIGGFHGGDTRTPYFRELIVRWFQYGTFCPLFRLHGLRTPRTERTGSGADNEVWSFGDEAYAIIKDLLFLRARLLPYIMEQMRRASRQGTPPMRPLFFDYPGDAAAWGVEDQFLFGPDLLVAPVLYEGARTRQVYLPDGVEWTDAWTGAQHAGGQWLTVPAPLERIPLFVRRGVDLPIRG
ncbi:MAG: glycoside hydrolase family 31 protein [Anaerolineae bacterium]